MNKLSAVAVIVGIALLTAALFIFILPLAQPTPVNPEQTETPIHTDSSLTVSPNVLWWGNLTRLAIAEKTVTVTNTGATDTQPLALTSDCTVGAVHWNLEGVTLRPAQTAEATIYLFVAWNATVGQFQFAITISG